MQTRLDKGDECTRYLKVSRTFYKPWFGSPRVLNLLSEYNVDIGEYTVSSFSPAAEEAALHPFCVPPVESVNCNILAGVHRCFNNFFPVVDMDEKVSFSKAVKSVSLLKGVGHGESNSCKNRQEALEKYLWWYKMCIDNEWVQPLVETDRVYWSVETFARVMMKEEVREVKKVMKNDVRAIMPCAMLLYLVENMLFEPLGAYMAKRNKHYYRFNSRYQGGYRRFIHSLRKYSLDGDVRKFDKSSTARLTGNWFRWQKQFFRRPYHRTLMDWVLSQLLFSPLVSQDGKIIERLRGLISGMFGTTHNGTGCVGFLICYTLIWNLVHIFNQKIDQAVVDVSNEETYLWKNTGDNVIVSSDEFEKLEKLDFDEPFRHWSMQFKRGKVVLSYPPKGERGGPEFLGDLAYHHPFFGYLPYPSNTMKIIASMGLHCQHPGHPVMDLLRIRGVLRGAYWNDEVRQVGCKLLADIGAQYQNWLQRDIIHVRGGQPITLATVLREDLSYPSIIALYVGLESSQVASNNGLILKCHMMFDETKQALWGQLRRLRFMRHGNWGGPGNAVRETGPPVDSLDAAFMEHDKGYEVHDYRRADRVVVKRISDLERSGLLRGKYAQAYANLARRYFQWTGGGFATPEDVSILQKEIESVDRKHIPVFENGVANTPNPSDTFRSTDNQSLRVQPSSKNFNLPGGPMAPIRRKPKLFGGKPNQLANKILQRRTFKNNRRGQKTLRRRQEPQYAVISAPRIPGQSGTHMRGQSPMGGMTMYVKERVFDLTQDGTTLIANGTLLINKKFNPANFPNCIRLAAQAKLYARYRVRKMWMEIIPTQTSSATGTWNAYWDPDPNDDPATLPVADRVFVATNHKGATTGIWWSTSNNKKNRYEVHAPLKPDLLYVDPSEDEVLLNTSHRFVMVTNSSGGLIATTSLATCILHATIDFWDPTVEPLFAPQMNASDLKATGFTAMSAALPFGSGITKSGGLMALNIVFNSSLPAPPGTVSYFVQTNGLFQIAASNGVQRYLVFCLFAGTTITAATMTVAGTHAIISQGTLINGAQNVAYAYVVLQVGATVGPLINNYFYWALTAASVSNSSIWIAPMSSDVSVEHKPKSQIGKLIQLEVQRQLKKKASIEVIDDEKDEKDYKVVDQRDVQPGAVNSCTCRVIKGLHTMADHYKLLS